MNIGDSIRFVRSVAGLTQEQMANRLGITGTHLSLVENSKSKPSLSLLERIESEFGVPQAFLVWNSHFESRSDDSDLSERYRKLGKQMQELAATLIIRSTHRTLE